MFPEQLKYVYLKHNKSKSYTVLKEHSIIDFYFSFLLNSLLHSKEEKSFYLNSIGNNAGKKCFIKYHLNSNYGYPLKDFDLTTLLDKFNVEDLIKIYLCLLVEYKLILIFEDYEDINTLIFSLIALIYPLKWNFPVVSFITQSLIETLEAPFGIIIGLPMKFLPVLNLKMEQKAITEETLIYNLKTKAFLYMPERFPSLPPKMSNELKSNIYMVLSEKLSLTSDVDNNETELSKMFTNDVFKEVNYSNYLNLRFVQVFFNLFLEIVKNLESSIYFNKVKSIKNSKGKFFIKI
jgi:hypothetical protein